MALKDVLKIIGGAIMAAIKAQIVRSHAGVKYRLVESTADILTASLKYDPILRGQALMGLSALGGAYAVKITPETIIAMSKLYSDGGRKMAAKFVELTVKPGYQIVLVSDFIADLTVSERKAVLYHELGHLVNKDLETPEAKGVLIEPEYELAADRYAAVAVGRKHMRNAILKLRKNMDLRITGQLSEEKAKEFQEELYGTDSLFEKRLTALA
jgi:Zn-dependent protease with chaperone function